ncbi:hypothetical protein PoB_000228000 [Plakobranchus ocellatus]|uniref:Glycosyltransferase family 92 protein n=1 Tax=Plakobranchus ocellatus TaxID=259542 RepID=A0AAV3XZ87_9GAST|nr:hypothetical protein PoB_000228000 [Plakobranchus ocellatus]
MNDDTWIDPGLLGHEDIITYYMEFDVIVLPSSALEIVRPWTSWNPNDYVFRVKEDTRVDKLGIIDRIKPALSYSSNIRVPFDK